MGTPSCSGSLRPLPHTRMLAASFMDLRTQISARRVSAASCRIVASQLRELLFEKAQIFYGDVTRKIGVLLTDVEDNLLGEAIPFFPSLECLADFQGGLGTVASDASIRFENAAFIVFPHFLSRAVVAKNASTVEVLPPDLLKKSLSLWGYVALRHFTKKLPVLRRIEAAEIPDVVDAFCLARHRPLFGSNSGELPRTGPVVCTEPAVLFQALHTVTGSVIFAGCPATLEQRQNLNYAPATYSIHGVHADSSPTHDNGETECISHDACYGDAALVSVDLTEMQHVLTIPPSFRSCRLLRAFEIAGMSSLQTVQDHVLSDCPNLLEFCVKDLPCLRSLGSRVVSCASRLQCVQLENLPQLISIGDNFASVCRCLSQFSIFNVPQLENIGRNFLSCCSPLSSIDFRCLHSLHSVGENFLCGCTQLTSVRFPDAGRLTAVKENFLQGCRKLCCLDFGHWLDDVEEIGNCFLSQCDYISSLNLGALAHLKVIGSGFLLKCESLRGVEGLSRLESLRSIGNTFMKNCSRVEAVDLSSARCLESVGSEFLTDCTSLTTLVLCEAAPLASVGASFLRNCCSLRNIGPLPLKNVEAITGYFMADCRRLESVDLHLAVHVTTIAYGFLSSCEDLTKVNFSGFSAVEEIGGAFMARCPSLKSLSFEAFRSLRKIGTFFLDGCSAWIDLRGLPKCRAQLIRETLSSKRSLSWMQRTELYDESRAPHCGADNCSVCGKRNTFPCVATASAIGTIPIAPLD